MSKQTPADQGADRPSDRDREIYEAVQIEMRSPAAVAKEQGLTTGEVRRIVERVTEERRRNRPPMPSPLEAARLHLARLETMWKMAMESFEASKKDEQIVTIVQDEHGERRTVKTKSRPKTGDQKTLKLADKIMQDIQKARTELAELEAKERVKEEFDAYSSTILERIEQTRLRE